MRAERGTATSNKPYRTVDLGQNRRLIFLCPDAYRRHRSGGMPRNYRPTLGQPRYSRTELREQMTVLRGGRESP